MMIQMNSSSHRLISIVVLPLLCFVSSVISQPDFVNYTCSDDYGNYTKDSPFKANLHTFLTSITSNTQINYGFYNLSVGQGLDKVGGIALCRPDVSTPDCRTCIQSASTKITQDCPSQKTAIGFYQNCLIWYSNSNMFKGLHSGHIYNMSHNNLGDVQNPERFNESVSSLLMQLANEAAMGDYRRKFATGEAQIGSKQKVYALLQCIPDMEAYDCLECFWLVMNFTLAECCYGKQSVWVVSRSCSIRYDNYRFYNSATVLPPLSSSSSLLLPPSASPTRKTKGNRSKKSRVVTIILTATAAPLLLIVLACYCLRRTRKPLKKVENDEEEDIKTAESLKMDFGTIKAATDNFASSNMLGDGGFGTVYKGRLSNGQAIAVKRLNKNSGQGKQEFENEALLMAKLQHRNVVRFLGFCIQKEEKLLIFEHLPNGSLDYFLFDPNKHINLDWQKRYKIIQGIARGLLYLHEESRLLVVHRDLKPSNILLDMEMNPKISDFGMARMFGVDQSHANTSKIVGTYGYMPPEYVLHGQFSIKSDVFSFGVLLLEILSGQKVSESSQAESGENLVSLAWRSWSEGNALSMVDSTMSGVNTTEVLRCIHIGLLCVQENASRRPIMSSVVLMLNSYSVTVPVLSQPAFLVQNDTDSEPHGSTNR